MKWNHPKNESQVQSYCIKVSLKGGPLLYEQDLTDISDTTIHINKKIGFGVDYQTQLRYIPKGYNGYHTFTTAGGLTGFSLGDSVKKFDEAFLLKEDNSVLFYYDGIFTKWNIQTGASSSVTASKDIKMIRCSPDGNYFGYIENGEYTVHQSSDLSIVKRMNIEAYVGAFINLNGLSISNTGLIVTSDNNHYIKIFDINTESKIFEKYFDINHFNVMISPDGKNIAAQFYNNSLVYFSFDGNQLQEIGNAIGVGEDVGAVLTFAPQSEQKMVISRWHNTYEYTVEERDSRTFELLNSTNIPSYYIPIAYDYETNQVIAQIEYQSEDYSYLII
jgi:WD40 repeat protein